MTAATVWWSRTAFPNFPGSLHVADRPPPLARFDIMIGQDDLITAVQQFLAAPPRQACLLLVHTDPARLEGAAGWLKERYDWPAWPVGRDLVVALLEVSPRERPGAAARWFRDAAATRRPGPILLTDITLLFEPSLELDPLRLLLDVSRQTALAVAWPGSVDRDRLAYGVPEHSHYRTWPKSALCPYCIVSL